ncbi:BCCT family transporter [Corynebacterium breve]|uniref:BCCT family transporter n=1 Tax=Corynebacterium breve TaxID=3049799 RepID=A0ABY8VD20_9CORY|nr:BCCT family transporter [Corynebacterium breve]WIM67227.1 BCCT family transporter [Corynebacterium breve]
MFVIAFIVTVLVIVWAFISPESLKMTGTTMQNWVVNNVSWGYTTLMIGTLIFMLVIGFGPTGRIRLGADDAEPEFSTASWVSMLFAAGLGIGLIFYGPMEPLTHYLNGSPAFDHLEPGTPEMIQPAMAQAVLHQASLPWVVYALVGAALAYSSYRRGRLPLISAAFEPVFPDGSNRILGKIIDVFSVLVTLFGTATSLGVGALQIRTGTSIVTGRDLEGNTFTVIAMSVLTVLFVLSAVSGVKTGIRLLSNANMFLVIGIGVFVLVAGPTVFLLDLIPGTLLAFWDSFASMMAVTPTTGAEEAEWLTSWTTLFWAWWISWSPFVGTFIAKISKGRTLREFVTVVLFVPSGISILWFVIMGGTTIWQNQNGTGISIEGSGENVLFDMFAELPFSPVMTIAGLLAIIIFFVTAADSSTNVMGSMSQSGRPLPSAPVTLVWGISLGLVSIALLLAGGRDALSGLQSIMVAMSLPFSVILVGLAVSLGKDLFNDPAMIRLRYARVAIRRGVKAGIEEHGDDFVFDVTEVDEAEGAGAEFDSENPAHTEWYTDVATEDKEKTE